MGRIATRTKRCLSAKPRQRRRPTHPPSPPPAQILSIRVLRSQTKAFAQARSTDTSSERKTTEMLHGRLDPWNLKSQSSKDPKPRAQRPTHFTCRICISHLPRENFIRWAHPKRWNLKNLDAPMSCIQHLARNPHRRTIDPVCKTCIGSTMAAQLDTLGARNVGKGCLEPGCSEVWPWEMVIKYFPVDKLEAFNLAAFVHWRVDTKLFTCISSSCSFTGILDWHAPGYPQIECPSPTCKARSCAVCLTPWHKEQTCGEARAAALTAQLSDADKETLTLMQSIDGKRCPNCQLVIEKDGGCPSMRCPGCRTYFRWNEAASAVPGAKKVLPLPSTLDYPQTAGHVACEADQLKGNTVDDNDATGHYPTNGDGTLNDMDATGEDPAMPLLDEDDADL